MSNQLLISPEMFDSGTGNVSEFTGESTITVRKDKCETLVIHENKDEVKNVE